MNTKPTTEAIHIAPPNIRRGEVWIRGTAPLVIHKFSDKAKNMIRAKQEAGSTANTKKKHQNKHQQHRAGAAFPRRFWT